MKLLFCVNRDIYANLALNRLLPELPGDEIQVLFSDAVGISTLPQGTDKAVSSIAQLHQPQISQPSGVHSLEWLRFYEQDLPSQYLFPLSDSLSQALPHWPQELLKSFTRLSQDFDVPMRAVHRINSPETVAEVEAFAPDVIVSIRFGQIFREPILTIPRHGVLNLHSGLLPEYRGVLATFWSMLRGKSQYGFTVHQITDASIDTGGMIERRSLPLDCRQSLFENILALYEPGAESLLEAIHTLRAGVALNVLPQAEAESAYYSTPTLADFDAFHRQGLRLMDSNAYFQWMARYVPLALAPTHVELEPSGCCQF